MLRYKFGQNLARVGWANLCVVLRYGHSGDALSFPFRLQCQNFFLFFFNFHLICQFALSLSYIYRKLFLSPKQVYEIVQISVVRARPSVMSPLGLASTAHPHNPRTTNTDRTDPLPGIKTFVDQKLF